MWPSRAFIWALEKIPSISNMFNCAVPITANINVEIKYVIII